VREENRDGTALALPTGMDATDPVAPHPPSLFGGRKRRSPRRRLVAVAALAGLGAGGWFAYDRYMGGDDAPPAYATQPAARGDVVLKVTATGTLSPVVRVEVGSQVSGRIAELRADYNSEVKAGEVIALIDPKTAQSDVAQAKARLASARADHERAKAVAENAAAQYDRTSALAKTGIVASAEVDAALANKRSAEASVSASSAAITVAKAAVAQAQVNLEYTTIRAPIDGVVISRNVDVGQTVAASLSAPVLFVIAGDLRQMEVHTSVAESDVGRLQAGMPVEFTVDAFSQRTFAGQVKQIRYEAANVSNVVTYDAVVAVANDELLLRPGMTTNASFIVDARRDVLAVSQKALGYRPADARERLATLRGARDGEGDGDRPRDNRGRDRDASRGTVWILRDGEPTPVRVTTGLSDGVLTEITSGDLQPEDLVITGDDTGGGPAARQPSQQQQRGQRGGRRGPPSVL
jgi:HlyD family secretion protein